MRADFAITTTMRFLFGSLLVSLSIANADIEVESRLDRREILIGDVVRYSVVVTRDQEMVVTMPPLAVNLGQFEIRDYQVHEPVKRGERVVEQTDYLLSTFETGEFVIPALDILYRMDPDTTGYRLKTEPLTIQVKSLNPDEAGDIRDVKPVLTPSRQWPVRIMLSLAVVLFLSVAGYFFWRRYRRTGESLLPAFRKPERPIHEVTLESLAALRSSDLLAKGEVKAYYTEFSDIVRRYIRGRYFIDAPEMTTSQLQLTMAKEEIGEKVVASVSEMLRLCDLVKFAKFIPEPAVHSEIIDRAVELVQSTQLTVGPEETLVEEPAIDLESAKEGE